MQSDIAELKDAVIAAQKANTSAIDQIRVANARSIVADDAARAAQQAAVALTAERDGLQVKVDVLDAKLKQAKIDHDALLAHYHRFKGICAAIVGLLFAFVVCLLIMRFAAPALNTLPGIAFAFGLPIAVGAAVGTFIMAL
jgi:uncharacterized membrane protein (DUF485 family)